MASIASFLLLLYGTRVSLAFQWYSGASTLPRNTRQMAIGYDPIQDRIYMMGGNPTSYQLLAYNRQSESFTDYGNNYFSGDGIFGWGQYYAQIGSLLYINDETYLQIFDLTTASANRGSINKSPTVTSPYSPCVTALHSGTKDYLMVIGGKDTVALKTSAILDVSNSQWITNIATLQQGRNNFACAWSENKVFVIGGDDTAQNTIEILDIPSMGSVSSQSWYYNVDTIPSAYGHVKRTSSIVYNSIIYVMGGFRNTPSNGYVSPNIQINAVTGEVSQIDSMAVTIADTAAILIQDIDNYIYAFAGANPSSGNANNFWQYTDTLTGNPTIDPTSATQNPTLVTQIPTLATPNPTMNTVNPTFATVNPTLATVNPSPNPTLKPTVFPTLATQNPTMNTVNPTSVTMNPSLNPSLNPSISPTQSTQNPTLVTLNPSLNPTFLPTISPTLATVNPSLPPTSTPTLFPTLTTANPTMSTANPTINTANPTETPTVNPTLATQNPTLATVNPSFNPSVSPTVSSQNPTVITINPTSLSANPSFNPTFIPSIFPSFPTQNPTMITANPTLSTQIPTLATLNPSMATANPTLVTLNPSLNPTFLPTISPITPPTKSPIMYPTIAPTNPTNNPSQIPTSVIITTEEQTQITVTDDYIRNGGVSGAQMIGKNAGNTLSFTVWIIAIIAFLCCVILGAIIFVRKTFKRNRQRMIYNAHSVNLEKEISMQTRESFDSNQELNHSNINTVTSHKVVTTETDITHVCYEDSAHGYEEEGDKEMETTEIAQTSPKIAKKQQNIEMLAEDESESEVFEEV